MSTTETKRGVFALMAAHCAGMLDLVALPVWVNTLIVQYHFGPQQAGGLATLFLAGASLASLAFAPRFTRHRPKVMAVAGFAVAAVTFLVASRTQAYPLLAALHFVGGLAAGTALSFTHGTIGHAGNPHRVFALVGLAIGVFGIAFLGGTPGLVARFGGPTLFIVFAGVMGGAALVGAFLFPRGTRHIASDDAEATPARLLPLGREVWFSVIGVALLALTQAMTLSFYQRIGLARGFGLSGVTLALVIYGIVTLFPAPLAAVLEKRVPAPFVISTIPLFQAVFAMIITHTHSYLLYAVSGPMMAFTILFVHTYAFGLLARLDPSGRTVAGTPAMLMVGAAMAPFIGGTLVRFIGFGAIGYCAAMFVAMELTLFNFTRLRLRKRAWGEKPLAQGVAPVSR